MTALAPVPPGSRAHVDRAIRLGMGLLLWLGMLVVAYWWDVDGGIRDLAGWATGLTSIGRITGLWSAHLLLVQVLLMSRLPPLEHAYGRDRLVRIHRVVGLASFWLMVTHIVTIILGYASGSWAQVPSTTWGLITGYGGILLAVAATAAIVMVVVTSIKAARRKLRYESWHLLHLYAYLGVGLALPHQLWTGQEFLRSPAATAYWWTLWIAAAGAVLIWRVLLPLWRSLRFRLRVESVVMEAADIVSVRLSGRSLHRLPLQAGQFVNVRFLSGRGWTRANPFSLSSAPNGHHLRITAKALGDGSSRLATMRPGTRVLFEGPYGRLSPRARSRHRVMLIGAGVGITPIRALAEGMAYRPGDAVLLQRYTDVPLFAREFQNLAARRGLDIIPLPGRRHSRGSVLGPAAQGLDEARVLRHWVPDVAERDIYICGPAPWANGVERLLAAAGVPTQQVHTESFGW